MGGGGGDVIKDLVSDPTALMYKKATDKRDEDKAKSQAIIDTAQADAAKIKEQADQAEETAMAAAQAEIDRKRRGQTQTLLFGTQESGMATTLKKTLG